MTDPPLAPTPGRPAVRIGRGPRAVETALLDGLRAWSERAARDPARLARPLRVVVPSRSLRDHLTGAALRRLRRPLVGVSIQTLFATALEVLERGGQPARAGRELYSLVIRRLVHEQPRLLEPLGGLADAHRVVEASVNDLLDAGLAPEHAEPLLDALAELEDGSGRAERARAILRVALAARERLDEAGLAHRSQLLERACDALEREPSLLPTSELWIHGFAEATGRATDLLVALARAHPTTLLLDEPGEPGRPDRVDPGAVFTRRLRERFEGLGGPAVTLAPGAPDAVPRELWMAPGAEAEVRAVAGRIRALLDGEAGPVPERIAVVTRQVAPYASAIRAHFGRLGIPFSGVAASVPTGAGARRAAALAALLEEGPDCVADRWVEILAGLPGEERDASPRADLRLGLRSLGAGRVRDVARLEPPERDLALPVRHGLHASDPDQADEADDASSEGDGRPAPHARYRRLRSALLSAAIERARLLVEAFDALPAATTPARWDAWLRERLLDDLGWDAPACDAALGDGLAGELPADLQLDADEARSILRERLRGLDAREPIGGRGGGVAVLGVMEARGRSFDHLFVLGLNRDVFPRPIREDPLLGDALRRALLDLIPDLPIKATGHDEERYLFAQLVASSPDVVLSWQSASDEGRERVRSTFIDRLCGNVPALSPRGLPPTYHPDQLRALAETAGAGGVTPRELAIWAGIGAEPPVHEAQLEGALREARVDAAAGSAEGAVVLDVARVARVRAACVREYGRTGVGADALGPYMGLVGPALARADLRHATRYVTSLESMAGCPWRTLLEKLLRLEAPPDPLETFPELDALAVGQAVHATLEGLLGGPLPSGGRPSLDALRSAEVRNVAWPSDDEIAGVAMRVARAQLEDQGHAYEGLVRVLARRACEHVASARELFSGAAVPVLGVEVTGELEVEDGDLRHALAFRADLVERIGGHLRLTDFKTGKPVSTAKQPATRSKHLLQRVASGSLLQAVAYALAAGGASDVGRYLCLRPGTQQELAGAGIERGTPEADAVESAFRAAVGTLAQSWDEGVFLPRLTEVEKDQTPRACGFCDVASACLQGDTAMRQRQREGVARLARRTVDGDAAPSRLEALHLDLWQLPARKAAPEESEPAGPSGAREGRS